MTASATLSAHAVWSAGAEQTFHPLVRWAFYAFVLSLPFEYPNRSFGYEITTLTGCAFLLATVVQPRACFRAPPAAFWWFLGFLYAFGVAYVVAGGRFPVDVRKSFLLLLQVCLILWVACNLLLDERIRTRALVALAASCLLLALLQLSDVVNAPMDGAESLRRVTVLGQNANRTARMLSLGLIATIGLAYGRAQPIRWLRPVAWAVIGALAFAILRGGSRGGLLALAAGLAAFAISGERVTVKLRNTVLAAVGLALLTWAAFASPLLRSRLERAEAGSLAGRERIFPAALSMVRDRPLFGFGPTANKVELAVRLRLPPQLHAKRDTHNLALEVLTATGLAGAIPFAVAFALCGWGGWRARCGSEGLVPLAMMVTVLVGNMSGNYLAYIPYWFVFAYAVASGRDSVPC